MGPNSSGSRERFMLGLNESKTFETLAPGSNEVVVKLDNTINQKMDGTLDAAAATILLESGEAAAAVAASLSTNLTGATNNDLVFTAKTAGAAGNAITVAYSDPGGVSSTLAIAVSGTAITITLGRATSAVNTTANDIKALVAGYAPAAALVSVADKAGNDGTGLVAALTATALSSGADATISWTTVTTTSVAAGGVTSTRGRVGRFARLRNTGSGLVTAIADFLHRVQPYQFL